jgi:TRAP-type mannitol/chloroaromatic compound transport system permease large subunit
MSGMRFGLTLMAIILVACAIFFPAPADMTHGHLGLLMLALIVVAIMLGFPTAFTLMGMGMFFGWLAFERDTGKILDLMVQRTYWVMTNDVLIAIPLFVFMGYVVERANIIDKLFRSLHFSLSRVPASLAVATLITCAIFATATGIVGAVVTLMGLLAFPAMIRHGYDVRLSAGAITAGGCLGILIPPSIMLIVYGATAGVSVVKLYAGAFLPGLMLASLYIGYVIIIGWWKPHLAPPLSEEDQRIPPAPWAVSTMQAYGSGMLPALWQAIASPARFRAARAAAGAAPEMRELRLKFLVSLFPLLLVLALGMLTWRYYAPAVQKDVDGPVPVEVGTSAPVAQPAGATEPSSTGLQEPPASAADPQPPGATPAGEAPAGEAREPQVLGGAPEQASAGGEQLQELTGTTQDVARETATGAQALGTDVVSKAAQTEDFDWGKVLGAFTFLLLLAAAWFYRGTDYKRLEVLELLLKSFFPLAVLILAVLGTIVFGLATPTEAAAVGSLGGILLALAYRELTLPRLRESVFLTARTTAMVCWLFVGSSIFSAAFALLGGQEVIEKWVLSMNLTPVQFMLLAQAIIFLLGWPLEWTEIIVIFMPIFVPLLPHFNIDPLFFGLLVALNLQTAFLSPPVAMAAFYLKGVAPPHVTLNQIFAGMMPFMLIQLFALFLLYMYPQIGLWLPEVLYK